MLRNCPVMPGTHIKATHALHDALGDFGFRVWVVTERLL